MKNAVRLFLLLCIALAPTAVPAQETSTMGSISGVVIDTNGSVVPGATVKVTGALGERTATTNDQGYYEIQNLVPGSYTVRVEKQGFKSGEVTNVTVFVGKSTTTKVTLEVGNISEVVTVTGGSEGINQASTETSSNLNDQLFSNIPVARAVSGLFYLAPGTTDSLGGGRDNPSISGGSALDNLYVADGVSITDSAFGGIGTFSRSYGALGTGINTSFIKEVQVKTAGFEPHMDNRREESSTLLPSLVAMTITAQSTHSPAHSRSKQHENSRTIFHAETQAANSCIRNFMTLART